jgi:hypothetical protein
VIVKLSEDRKAVALIFTVGTGDDEREEFCSNLSRQAAFDLLEKLRDACGAMLRGD